MTQSSAPGWCIWVYALCICQTDRAERNSQFSIMGDIYSRCSVVLVWLGEAIALGRLLKNFFLLHDVVEPAV